jgi:ankyrin repeat protein
MDNEGRTPLDRAMNSGHRAIAEMLLLQEKDDLADAENDSTPMHRAAKLGLTAAVQSLISYGFDAMRVDKNRDTPLHLAVREGRLETARVLLDASDVNARNNQGLSPLHWATLRGDKAMCALLIEYGADPHMRDENLDGLSPIHVARVMEYGELSEALSATDSFY